jgi:transcriptional regulator with XRE-family HTH domain
MVVKKAQGKYTLGKIAKKLGVSTAYLSMVKNGKRRSTPEIDVALTRLKEHGNSINVNKELEYSSLKCSQADSKCSQKGSNSGVRMDGSQTNLRLKLGAGDEIRTRDFLLGKQTFYH